MSVFFTFTVLYPFWPTVKIESVSQASNNVVSLLFFFVYFQATSKPSPDSDEYNSVKMVTMATASDVVTRQLLVKV